MQTPGLPSHQPQHPRWARTGSKGPLARDSSVPSPKSSTGLLLPTFTLLPQQPWGAAASAPAARMRNSSANLELRSTAAVSASTSTASPSWGHGDRHGAGTHGPGSPSRPVGYVGTESRAQPGPKPGGTPTGSKQRAPNHLVKPPGMFCSHLHNAQLWFPLPALFAALLAYMAPIHHLIP